MPLYRKAEDEKISLPRIPAHGTPPLSSFLSLNKLIDPITPTNERSLPMSRSSSPSFLGKLRSPFSRSPAAPEEPAQLQSPYVAPHPSTSKKYKASWLSRLGERSLSAGSLRRCRYLNSSSELQVVRGISQSRVVRPASATPLHSFSNFSAHSTGNFNGPLVRSACDLQPALESTPPESTASPLPPSITITGNGNIPGSPSTSPAPGPTPAQQSSAPTVQPPASVCAHIVEYFLMC